MALGRDVLPDRAERPGRGVQRPDPPRRRVRLRPHSPRRAAQDRPGAALKNNGNLGNMHRDTTIRYVEVLRKEQDELPRAILALARVSVRAQTAPTPTPVETDDQEPAPGSRRAARPGRAGPPA